MTLIRYPDHESVNEITARYLLSLPVASMPLLYGFRFDGTVIHAVCAGLDLTGDRLAHELNPLHVCAANLRNTVGAGMFGFGLVFVVCADQLTMGPENRHIPEQVRTAAVQLPGFNDLIVAVVIDAQGRQWWAVAARHLPELDPVRLHIPAMPPARWRIPETLDASLWTAAIALDPANHSHLLRLSAGAR